MKILVIDDNPTNVELLEMYLAKEGHEVITVYSGQEALKIIAEREIDLIFLDIIMPYMDGFTVDNILKSRDITKNIPVIFTTESTDTNYLAKALNLGGINYITKPFDEKTMLHLLESYAKSKDITKNLDEQLKEKNLEMDKLNQAFVVALEKANYYNDDDTGNHIRRVSEYSKIIASGYNLSKEMCNQIHCYASLHDIGKVGIPDHILKKPASLSYDEFEIMKTHSYIGYKMIADPAISKVAKNIVYSHHEKYDGTGYPRQLKGNQIPIEARIVALADVYDALHTEKVYKPAYSLEESDKIIMESSGTQFDPDITEIYQHYRAAFCDINTKFAD